MTIAELNAKQAAGAAAQERINALAESGQVGLALAVARAEARKSHAQYAQYKGHWDGWKLGRVNARTRTKLGTAVEAGDYVMVKRGVAWLGSGETTIYSVRNGIDTRIATYVQEVTA